MTWELEYDDEEDETVIYWKVEEQGSVDGRVKRFKNGYPLGEAKEVIADAIQSAGTPKRIRMQYDLNYGFKRL